MKRFRFRLGKLPNARAKCGEYQPSIGVTSAPMAYPRERDGKH
jgi:hypothetical protein